MFAPSTALVGPDLGPVPVVYLAKGRKLLGWRMKAVPTVVQRISPEVSPRSVTILTVAGRRLTCAGKQKLAVRVGGRIVTKSAESVRLRDILVTELDGGLAFDRVSCTVHTDKPGEPWIKVKTSTGNVFAEGILCRTS